MTDGQRSAQDERAEREPAQTASISSSEREPGTGGCLPSRLDEVTKLASRRSRWGLTLYPDAGEAVISYQTDSTSAPVGTSTPEEVARAALCRARSTARRYCKANGLDRLWTLTFRDAQTDPARVVRYLGSFFKRLRARFGRLPYLWVLEWHPGGHGIHVHFALGRYVPKNQVEELWGHGFVDARRFWRRPGREVASVAGYVTKYLGKAMDDREALGRHRYDVAQGFQPAKYTGEFCDEFEAASVAWEWMDARPSFVWRSEECEGWAGPPVRVLFFDD